MGRPRTRHGRTHAALDAWGEYVVKLRAYGQRSRTPEARLIEEGNGAAFSKEEHRQGKPLLPGSARLKTPERIKLVDDAVASLPPLLGALARLVYVEKLRPGEIQTRANLSTADYEDAMTALLVNVDLVLDPQRWDERLQQGAA
jgi:DNA-directed RNA polymerase specialized sigma24 family protein